MSRFAACDTLAVLRAWISFCRCKEPLCLFAKPLNILAVACVQTLRGEHLSRCIGRLAGKVRPPRSSTGAREQEHACQLRGR